MNNENEQLFESIINEEIANLSSSFASFIPQKMLGTPMTSTGQNIGVGPNRKRPDIVYASSRLNKKD